MNLAIALSLLICTNLLISFSYLILRCLRRLDSRTLLRLHTAALIVTITAPLAMLLTPKQSFFQPPAKIWSAPSLKDSASHLMNDNDSGFLRINEGQAATTVDTSNISTPGIVMALALFLAGLTFFVRDTYRLFQIRKNSYLVRRVGRVRVFVSPNISVPFSYATFTEANVVVPANLLEKPLDYRIAIQHELQHHRQGDTKTVYAIWCLRLACIANPFVHLWARELSEIQEFACDETLVDLKKVDSHAYARCLFEVAQTARGLKRTPVCATGLAFKTDGPLLKRRINMMLYSKNRKPNKAFAYAAAFTVTAILTLGAYASTGLVQDRRVTLLQAEKLVAVTKSKSSFPIAMNERVLRQLNRYVGTPEGRDFMRTALARMENERAPIEKMMKKYGVPRELLAMPLIESGYENLAQIPDAKNKSAGLWQFTPRTAEIFGMVVERDAKGNVNGRDDRLDKALESDAAMRLLVSNKMRFNDWLLSVSAYNAGEERVQEGIDKTGSRDAWTLVGKGFEGDHDYLAKLTAAILIMNSPETVQ